MVMGEVIWHCGFDDAEKSWKERLLPEEAISNFSEPTVLSDKFGIGFKVGLHQNLRRQRFHLCRAEKIYSGFSFQVICHARVLLLLPANWLTFIDHCVGNVD